MRILFVLPLLFSKGITDKIGNFTQPAPNSQTPSWSIGSQQVIAWETNLTNFTIALWNEDGGIVQKGPGIIGISITSFQSLFMLTSIKKMDRSMSQIINSTGPSKRIISPFLPITLSSSSPFNPQTPQKPTIQPFALVPSQ